AWRFCVENLNADDRFEIVRFSTEAEPLFHDLVPADPDHRKRANGFIDDFKPIGGTAIAGALQSALKVRPQMRETGRTASSPTSSQSAAPPLPKRCKVLSRSGRTGAIGHLW